MASQTPPSIQLEQVLKQKFPGIRFGRYNCRKISGSTYWSQHSWNNALDIYPPKHISYATQRQEYQDYLDIVHAFIKSELSALNVRVLLWRVRNHYNHIHADFWPRGWATPPCAGGSPRYKYPNGDVKSTTTLIHSYDGNLDPIDPIYKEKDMLIKGDKGLRVEKAQLRLLELGYTLPQWGADGDFGNETEAAVKQFQTDHGLPVDGILYSVDISLLFELDSGGEGALQLALDAHTRLNKLHEV